MSSDILEYLDQMQSSCLETLKISSYSQDTDYEEPDDGEISGIKSFSFNGMDGSFSVQWLANIFYANDETLKHLCLGAESTVSELYNRRNGEVPVNISNDFSVEVLVNELKRQFLDYAEVDLAEAPLLKLDTLELKGLEVSRIIRTDILFQDWRCLTTLAIASCNGLEQAFNVLLYREKNQSALENLCSFYIRHENSSRQFRTLLLKFLGSIPGLLNLSVLLETVIEPQGLGSVLAKHGNTLKTLVWEERTQRRDTFIHPLGYKLPWAYQLMSISQTCPNLIELGVFVDWNDITGGADSVFQFGQSVSIHYASLAKRFIWLIVK